MLKNFFHLICSFFGLCVLYYEFTYIGVKIIFQYSGWFLVSTTLIHSYQLILNPPSTIVYPICSISLLIILPSAIPSIIPLHETLASTLLYGAGNHVILPICTIFHLNGTYYNGLLRPISFLILYNIFYSITVETLSNPMPYWLLRQVTLEIRILLYAAVIIVGIIGVFGITRIPWIRRSEEIRV